MSHLQETDALPTGAVALFRPRVPALVSGIVRQIQHDVERYSGSEAGKRHRLITLAVTAAVEHFLDLAERGPREAPRVDDLFRRMGYGEAIDGRDLSAMRQALHIATRDVWTDLRDFAGDHGLSADTLGILGDALFDYIEHLARQTAIGHDAARAARERDIGSARSRLLAALLKGASPEEIRTGALEAVWPVPDALVVLCAQDGETLGPLDLSDLGPHALVATGTDPLIVVCGSDDVAGVLTDVRNRAPTARLSVSWPVPADDVRDARRWCERALALVAWGVIPAQPVIRCAEHRTHLWLHAEPALRRRLCQELLRPLLAETPNSREILSETLLVWLETRDSAPSIAAALGVHPQTVRYRWKRINELFGEDLRDPEFVVQLTMLLKASVPLWKAGDQSDFERYRSAEGA